MLAAVSEYYHRDPGALRRSRDRHVARSLAAWLCRRHTVVPLSELAAELGLLRGDSVPALVRRFEGRLKNSPWLKQDVEAIEQRLTTRTSALGGVVAREEDP